MLPTVWLLLMISRLRLTDLAARSEDEYMLKAKDLALDTGKRQFLRCHLRPKMEEKVCNASIFVKEIELMYQSMIEKIIMEKAQ